MGFEPLCHYGTPGYGKQHPSSNACRISKSFTWPEKALELVLAAKYWAPEGPQTLNDKNIFTIIWFLHPELAFANTTHLVRVWSWMCNPSHGNTLFGFKNEQYKREHLWKIQVTYNDIQHDRFRYCLRGTKHKESLSKARNTRKKWSGNRLSR